MYFKEASALMIGLSLCVQMVKAERTHLLRDTIKTKRVDIERVVNSKKSPVQPIDTLTIKHEDDLGNSHFESLLAKQLSPLKIKMEATRNQYVQSYIDKFSANNYRFHLSKMLGLSKYYFPIFESAFEAVGVPREIKYLAIIESSLNPNAVSRMGATGPWQFMYATAKGYGLTIDSYIDERKDPIAASLAAAQYLKQAYELYQDWFLAIASYNTGAGNVNRAIKRSGIKNPTFWQIRHLLPNETKNYIPAFIAIHHVLENHEKYGIQPDNIALSKSTEVIMVDRSVPFSAIAEALDINEEQIASLNPAYKRKVINGSKEKAQRLIVPLVDKVHYTNLYYALQGQKPNDNQLQYSLASNSKTLEDKPHRVEKGETLEKIALKYGVSIQDLKVWNKLKSNRIVPGQQLKILGEPSPTAKPSPSFISYTVKRGDTLSGIAKRYNIKDIKQLKAVNNLKSDFLKVGMTLKIDQI